MTRRLSPPRTNAPTPRGGTRSRAPLFRSRLIGAETTWKRGLPCACPGPEVLWMAGRNRTISQAIWPHEVGHRSEDRRSLGSIPAGRPASIHGGQAAREHQLRAGEPGAVIPLQACLGGDDRPVSARSSVGCRQHARACPETDRLVCRSQRRAVVWLRMARGGPAASRADPAGDHRRAGRACPADAISAPLPRNFAVAKIICANFWLGWNLVARRTGGNGRTAHRAAIRGFRSKACACSR